VFTIGKLARIVDVSSDTLRYYEREGLIEPAGKTMCACRNASPWRRKISATSRAGTMAPAQPCGTTSKRSRSSGLGVLLIVLVATRV
jgi:hypothetical protein